MQTSHISAIHCVHIMRTRPLNGGPSPPSPRTPPPPHFLLCLQSGSHRLTRSLKGVFPRSPPPPPPAPILPAELNQPLEQPPLHIGAQRINCLMSPSASAGLRLLTFRHPNQALSFLSCGDTVQSRLSSGERGGGGGGGGGGGTEEVKASTLHARRRPSHFYGNAAIHIPFLIFACSKSITNVPMC